MRNVALFGGVVLVAWVVGRNLPSPVVDAVLGWGLGLLRIPAQGVLLG